MEDAPIFAEDNQEDDSEDDSRKKKRAALLGGLFVESKAGSEDGDDKKEKSLVEWLRGDKAESGNESEEAPAAEAPLESLGEDEKQQIEVELVRQLPPVEAPPAEVVADQPEEAAEAQAVEVFRAKIVEEGLDSEQALNETLELVGAEAAVEPVAEEPAEEPIEAPAVEGPQEITEQPLDLRTPEAPAIEPPTAEEGPDDDAAQQPRFRPAPSVPPGGGLTSQTAERPGISPREAQNQALGAALVGGIVGYLIGRRRGRIKTEKRLKPVQEKLEKQVQDLHSELVDKEFALRQAAKRQAKVEGGVVAKRLRKAKPEKAEKAVRVEKTKHEQVREAAPEARQLHQNKSHERIGKVLIGAEANRASITERPSIERDASTLTRGELLAVSQKIIIEGTTLRAIYENNLLSEKALRRVVTEYLRGGDFRAKLKREMVEHQIDFERDPATRGLGAVGVAHGGTESPRLEHMLAQAEALASNDEEHERAVLETRAEHQKAAAKRHKHRRRTADYGFVAVIAILLGLVIFLLITRQ